jgi:membrane protease YdiL (CAAX protease family)
MNKVNIKPITIKKSLLLFGVPSIIFYIITKHVIPYALLNLGFEYIFAWFLFGGLGVFIPLFILTFVLLKNEQKNLDRVIIVNRLRLHKPNKKQIYVSIAAALACFVLSGLVVLTYNLLADLTNLFGRLYSSQNSFDIGEANPFLILIAWLPFFFFNIFGEELLWRGFILPGQIENNGNIGWILNSFFWFVFHLSFDFQLLITLLPILILLPYLVQKYQNTWIGIIIHALYNGPIFVLITFGVIS